MHIFTRFLKGIFFALLFSAIPSFAMQLGDKMKTGQKGDYIVTEQDKMHTVLLLRSKDDSRVVLEEISVPASVLSAGTDWKKWVQEGAKGHTSWTMYEIDTSSFFLLEAYSFTKRGWLFCSEDEDFLTKLMRLSLTKVQEEERKKVGPLPHSDEIDRRKTWNPSIKIEGKKQKIDCSAFKAVWPKDDTLLSGCSITLYFPSDGRNFFFPCWIEASNGHFTQAIKTVDSGRGMVSALQQNIPRRPPKISSIKKHEDKVRMQITSAPYYRRFKVFAFDITRPFEHIGPLPFTHIPSEQKGNIALETSQSRLSEFLSSGHRYKWIVIPEESNIFYVESEDIFLWPNVGSR